MISVYGQAKPNQIGGALFDTTKIFFEDHELARRQAFEEHLPRADLNYKRRLFPEELVLWGIVEREDILAVIQGERNKTVGRRVPASRASEKVGVSEDYL